ncbi:IS3 family transposase [Streptomyces sp. NPDC014623]|uniref:IS3 family transposase n=1 Tax=Streptomyces sp. NPDC014623 TaxID=3364875 RepID=UPI00370201A3
MKPLIQQAFEVNHRVYGAKKVWRELRRQGHIVARRTVERLMRELGVAGAVRGKKIITTIPESSVERHRTCWTAISSHRPRTAAGPPTSPTSEPGRQSSTSPSSWIPSPAGSSADPPPRRGRHGSSWTPRTWPGGNATAMYSLTNGVS